MTGLVTLCPATTDTEFGCEAHLGAVRYLLGTSDRGGTVWNDGQCHGGGAWESASLAMKRISLCWLCLECVQIKGRGWRWSQWAFTEASLPAGWPFVKLCVLASLRSEVRFSCQQDRRTLETLEDTRADFARGSGGGIIDELRLNVISVTVA